MTPLTLPRLAQDCPRAGDDGKGYLDGDVDRVEEVKLGLGLAGLDERIAEVNSALATLAMVLRHNSIGRTCRALQPNRYRAMTSLGVPSQ